MTKKIFLIFSFLTTLISNAQIFAVNGINYKITSATTVEVSDNSSFAGTAVIPSVVINAGESYNVTAIGDFAFLSASDLTSISIPSSVISIGDAAFNGCFALSWPMLPNSITSIGAGAFANCYFFIIEIPNSITSISDQTFKGCISLREVILPNSITSIGEGAFQSCPELEYITLPPLLNSIGISAFSGCSFESVQIPDLVTSIGSYAFASNPIQSIILGKSVNFIGDFAFLDGLYTEVQCKNPTPISITPAAFTVYQQEYCKLIVPSSSVDAYKEADNWKNFNPIVGDLTILSTTERRTKNTTTIYPNPIHNEAILELKNSNNSKLEIYDMTGKRVHQKSLKNNSKNTINTSTLLRGTYLFKVGKSVTKVIKN